MAAEKDAFRSDLREFVRLYAFLSQILPYEDTELERLYLFTRHLVRYLPVEKERLPREIQDQIDMESWGMNASGEPVRVQMSGREFRRVDGGRRD